MSSRKSSRSNIQSVQEQNDVGNHQDSTTTSSPSVNAGTVGSRLTSNIESEQTSSQYQDKRKALVADDRNNLWDARAKARASPTELRAQKIVKSIREHERIDPELFGNLPGEAVPTSTTHDLGGRFLHNLPSIQDSKLFDIARHMPKGSHLHLHFNSEIQPERLFPSARRLVDTMCVRTTRALSSVNDYNDSEIVFAVLRAETQKSNIFSPDYSPDLKAKGNSPWMLWTDFRRHFSTHAPKEVIPSRVTNTGALDAAELWARQKMIITKQDAYDDHQTHNGAWACFNQGTRAFKGLLNYESIYRWYIGHAIDSMIADRVMYAELRPMLLDKSLPSDDGREQLNHAAQMNIICEEVRKKKKELESQDRLDRFPFGLKIIYATPRSIPRAKMQSELEDCINLKLQFPELICGFDLVGAEDRPNHIGFYADLLVAFTKTCQSLNIKIPFMFHAGETLLDTGGSHSPDNSNLYDSLLLNAKRIGHGYALLKHPHLVEKYKAANICLELCPISNELLHLCGNARQHPYPQLLAAGLHATLNADNPSLFR